MKGCYPSDDHQATNQLSATGTTLAASQFLPCDTLPTLVFIYFSTSAFQPTAVNVNDACFQQGLRHGPEDVPARSGMEIVVFMS